MADTKARIVISAKDDTAGAVAKVRSSLAQLDATSGALAATFRGLGSTLVASLTVGALTQFFRSTVNGIEQLKDLAEATGSTVEAISGIEDVAARSGTSLDTVGQALIRFNQALSETKTDSANGAIFKRLGLDAQALRAEDPSEALRQTAVALARFRDDGDKARAVQQLFGRSLREVAPLLKDLAEAGSLNAKVTREQAEQAERFNNQLSSLGKNATDFGRQIGLAVLPKLNEMLERMKQAPAIFGSFGAALLAAANPARKQFVDASEGIRFYTKELEALDERVNRKAQVYGQSEAERRFGGDRRELEQFLKFYREAAKVAQQVQTMGADFTDRSRGRSGSDSIGPFPPAGEVKKDGKRYEVEVSQALNDALRALDNTDTSQLERLKAQLTALFEINRESRGAPAVVDAIRQTQIAIDALQQKAQPSAISDYAERLKQLFLAGDKDYETQNKPLDDIGKKLQEVGAFAEQAARNIQDALGDTTLRVLRGDFDSIGELWRDLLQRMAAQAAAAQIGQFLFGDTLTGGSNGGALGDLFKFIAGKVKPSSTGIDSVPQDQLMLLHRGERVVPAYQNKAGAWGGGTINQTINIAAGVSRAEVTAAVAEGNRQFLRSLQAQGVL